MDYYGFDVSKYQGLINWNQIPDKYSFTIIRAGYGLKTSQKDEKFDTNMQGALSRGLNVGCYWFLYALNVADAIKNAESFLQVIKPYEGKIKFPLFLDIEGDSIRYMKSQGVEPSKYLISEMVRAFLTVLEDAGYYAAVYADNGFINQWFHADILTSYDLWFAYWVSVFNPDFVIRPCGIWQYTSRGIITGISGHVDLNYTTRDYPEIIKKARLNHFVDNIVENVDKLYNVDVKEENGEVVIRIMKR